MLKRGRTILLIFIASFAFLVTYNIRIWFPIVAVCPPNEIHSIATLAVSSTNHNEATRGADLLLVNHRWKARVASLGSCTSKVLRPTWKDFFDLVEGIQHNCSQMKVFGGIWYNFPWFDGSKSVCMDAAMLPRPCSCTVLSFGINNEWSFDDAMAVWGCEVYSFDPVMGVLDHTRGIRIHFHSLGLSGKSEVLKFEETEGPVDSYRGVLKHIGLINQTIDYLKIDIEGSEILFFENVLFGDITTLQHVKQMAVEIHVWKFSEDTRDRVWRFLHRLSCLGFKKVLSERNGMGGTNTTIDPTRRVSCCYELLWINEAYL